MIANEQKVHTDNKLDVVIEFSPVYELAISLYAYLDKKNKKILELGQSWYKQVDEQLSPQFKEKLKVDRIFLELGIDLLIIHSSPRKQSIPQFLAWLDKLKDGEMEQIILPILPEGFSKKDIIEKLNRSGKLEINEKNVFGVIRDHLYDLYWFWYDEFFSKIKDEILSSLEQNAMEKKELSRYMDPIDLIEKVTNGLVLEDVKVDTIFLIPQYHSNPINIYPFSIIARDPEFQIFFYPIDIHTMNSDEPSAKLMRLARCVADQTRLKILRFIYREQKSFTDIVNEIGLAKSTVHHHLVMLRAAGLIRLFISEENGTRYCIRTTGVQELSNLIQGYLKS